MNLGLPYNHSVEYNGQYSQQRQSREACGQIFRTCSKNIAYLQTPLTTTE
jgi:hypothetical protein